MALGHYVHGRYSNYLAVGLGYKYGEAPNPQQIFNDQVNMLKNQVLEQQRLSPKDIYNLERQLNFYYKAIKQGGIENSPLDAQTLKTISNMLQTALAKDIRKNKANIDMETLGVSANESTVKRQIRAHDQAKEALKVVEDLASKKIVGDDAQNTSLERIQSYIKALMQLREQIIRSNSIEKSTISLMNKIKQLDNIMSQIIKDYNNESLKKGANKSGLTQFAGHTQFVKITDLNNYKFSKTKTFLDALQDVYNSLARVSAINLAGNVGEAMAALIPAILNSGKAYSEAEMLDLLYNANSGLIKGNNTVRRSMGSSAFTNAFVKVTADVDGKHARLNPSEKWGTKNLKKRELVKVGEKESHLVSVSGTQDKVDVEIVFNDMKIPATVKNYNLATDDKITLLKGSSLLEPFVQYEDFLYHYLNVKGIHNGPNDSEQPGSGLINAADRAFKLTTLLHALAGGVWSVGKSGMGKGSYAEILVLNDSSKGEWKVYSIHKILDKIEQQINELRFGSDFNSLMSSSLEGNEWIGGFDSLSYENARQRITNLLSQLDSIQLHVSIDTKSLQ